MARSGMTLAGATADLSAHDIDRLIRDLAAVRAKMTPVHPAEPPDDPAQAAPERQSALEREGRAGEIRDPVRHPASGPRLDGDVAVARPGRGFADELRVRAGEDSGRRGDDAAPWPRRATPSNANSAMMAHEPASLHRSCSAVPRRCATRRARATADAGDRLSRCRHRLTGDTPASARSTRVSARAALSKGKTSRSSIAGRRATTINCRRWRPIWFGGRWTVICFAGRHACGTGGQGCDRDDSDRVPGRRPIRSRLDLSPASPARRQCHGRSHP